MANPSKSALESALEYPLGDTLPAPGQALEVLPGVRWVRMGLPFALDHINLWLLGDVADDGREGWAVVDCGITNEATRSAWEQVFDKGLDGLPVLRVIVTHMHPDHIGLAHWLCERWGVRLWISATDYHVARLGTRSTTGFGGGPAAAFFASQGLGDDESVAKIRARANYYPSMVPEVPPHYRRLLDGDTLVMGSGASPQRWRLVSGYGHAPEHMALHNPDLRVLISGDMVLPRISTNVSVFESEPEANPLPLYLNSIERFRTMAADTLVLPSHGKPFRGLHTRIDQLHAHHQARLAEVLHACAQRPCSGADIVPLMFRPGLDLHQMTFAIGEAVAHLHMLWQRGQLRRKAGADGVWRFTA
jgi:glyoxylase-like metal-dependent hydrolase (beta-lactamase superfamily II)